MEFDRGSSSFLLEELLAPVSLEDFRRDYFGRKPYAAPRKAKRFGKLIDGRLLDEIFRSGHSNCWLPKEGRLPVESERASGSLNLKMALDAFREGRTILIRKSEEAHPRLREIAEDFGRLFGGPVDVQIYATPQGETGFDWHYDIEDVFVIQSSGEKEFFLRRNRRNPPCVPVSIPLRRSELEQEWEGAEIRCTLCEGDWLYIPAGYWHKARAIRSSFHFSVGVLDKARLGIEDERRRHGPL